MALFLVRDGFSRHSCPNPALAFQARAGFGHLCREKPISHSEQCHMHIISSTQCDYCDILLSHSFQSNAYISQKDIIVMNINK